MVMLMLASLAWGAPGDLPREMRLDDDPQDQAPLARPDRLEPAGGRGSEGRILDFSRFETELFVGSGTGGDLFAGLSVRAPMPWLSPEGRADGEYFGLFTQLKTGSGGGNSQGDSGGSGGSGGGSIDVALGVDYTFVRTGKWVLLAQLGVEIGPLDGGSLGKAVGPMVGVAGGMRIGGTVWIVLNPQLTWSGGGRWVESNALGVRVVF